MSKTDDLISRYYEWLKAKTNWREINDWVEITTPYLDRHNDCIQIYLKRQGSEWLLTDDGYTLADLAQSGCEIDTPRRKALLATTLNGFGVQQIRPCCGCGTNASVATGRWGIASIRVRRLKVILRGDADCTRHRKSRGRVDEICHPVA